MIMILIDKSAHSGAATYSWHTVLSKLQKAAVLGDADPQAERQFVTAIHKLLIGSTLPFTHF